MPEGAKVYFDTMLYLNKFVDPMKTRPETNNMFSKVKTGEFRLVVSQIIFVEMYHVMCLPLEKITRIAEAADALQQIRDAYFDIKRIILQFPNTEIAENELDGIDTKSLTTFVENVPGSKIADFLGMRKFPGSMDFMHLVTAANLKCDKFFTEDKGVLLLDSYNYKGNMKIVKPYRA